jgi:Domain of unknown function (DUF4417)
MTDHACPENFSANMPGGDAVSHPLKPGTLDELRELGGPGFDDIAALPVPILVAPNYIPQPRHRRSLRGFLTEDLYILRATDVVKRRRVISAEEMRGSLGLRTNQRLVLMLFDRDKLLEEIWERGVNLVEQLAAAGYEAIIAPSFSTYTPRPHTEYMINMRRSMIYFRLLQEAGAYAIPRVAWIVSGNARQLVDWAQKNPVVEMFALDLATYRCASDWREQLEGLQIFDSLTDHRLTFLINGASTQQRCEQLFEVLGSERIKITNATTQARIASRVLRSTGDQTGATFKSRLAVRRGAVEAATRRIRERSIRRRVA